MSRKKNSTLTRPAQEMLAAIERYRFPSSLLPICCGHRHAQSFDGLCGLVNSELGHDPTSGDVYVFVTAAGTDAKRANAMLDFIGELCEIERRAREKKLDFKARHELRQKEAKPILTDIKDWLDEA